MAPAQLDRSYWLRRLAVAIGALVLLAGTWSAIAYQARRERAQALEAALEVNVGRVVAFSEYVRRTLEGADILTRQLARQHARWFQAPTDEARMRPLEAPEVVGTTYRAASVIDRAGNVIGSTVRPLPRMINIVGDPRFEWHRRNADGRLHVSAPVSSRYLAGRFIYLSRRVDAADGSFAGIAAVQIDPSALIDFYKNVPFREADLISVIGLDGVTRARRTGNVESYGEDVGGRLVMWMQQRRPNGTYRGPNSLDGETYYFSHRRLPEFNLFVTSGIKERQVFAPAERRSFVYMLVGGIVSLLVLGVAVLLLLAINRRARRDREIAEVNARLAEAQRIARIGDWVFDLETQQVFWSRELCLMYGRHPSDNRLTLDEFALYLDAEGLPLVEDAMRRAEETRLPQEYEFVAHMPDGEISHRHVVVVPTFDEDGTLIRLHGTDQDVSARKLLDALQAEVAHLARLDAMNAMAATLAHELNQPLTAATNYLSGSVRIVSGEAEIDRSQLHEVLATVRRQLMHAAEIIRRVRTSVARSGGRRAPCSLREIAGEAITLINAAGQSDRATILYDFAPDAEHVVADPVQVQQVLVNILRNAIEAGGGRPVSVTSVRHGDMVVICVADEGPGIPETAGDIFSPFSTSKQKGLGLGLSISRTIIEQHQGRIWVEDTGPEGTRLCFSLPAAAAEAVRNARRAAE
jgi:signal transduction histidine kinase